MSVENGNWFSNQKDVEARLLSVTRTQNTYTITDPAGGAVRTFDPNTATLGDALDFIATLASDIMG